MSGAIHPSGPLHSERFEIRGRLGEGAFGEVFRVFDRQLKTVVALKTLNRAEPAALYHFKKEFRALAGVHHRNLVELYELLSVEDRWFFTMELVEGHDFLRYASASATGSTLDLPPLGAPPPDAPPPAAPPDVPPLRHLRGALKQLAEGLSALHLAGKLHRDIKPSNIKVTPEGRLVLLDFGLVKELVDPKVYETSAGEVLGTPAYMPPEQAAGGAVTEASDWYAVGCVLYEALAGRPLFRGGLAEIMRAKQSPEQPAAREVDPTLPEDLDALCRELVFRDPARRPSGEEVLRRLGGAGAGRPAAGFARPPGEAVPFVGRGEELAALRESFDRTRQGRSVAVFVHGSSGLGKSALVEKLIAQLRAGHPEAVVLAGRCYERESVPYKGLDPLVDTLSGYLKQLPPADAESLVPEGVWALARLFPALRRVPAVARAGREVLELPDPREQRRQARAALRDLLRRLAERQPTVLYIDDLQWSDRDSANLLAYVLGPPDPPPILLLSCERRGGREEIALLHRLLSTGPPGEGVEVRRIEVGRLSFQEACELGRQLSSDRFRDAQAVLRTLARESAGNPFFMAELVRYAGSELEHDQDDASFGPGIVIPLENLIWSRLERLPAAARRLLDVVAVAGRPVALEVAAEAAHLGDQAQQAVTDLLAASLACLGGEGRQELESYHDRIRETAVQGLDPTSLELLHRQLATALQATGRADAETLAMHFHAAGDHQRAAELAVAAARRASEALAFDRAARLYRLALDLEGEDSGERQRLRVALADSLARVGRCPGAAEAYLAAAAGAGGIEALELRRRAAVQQFFAGNARAAVTMIRQLLSAAGTRLPSTSPGVLLSLLGRRLYLKLRGLGFEQRPASQVPPRQLLRIDACWSCAGAAIEPLIWMELATRHLLLALDAGEPRRIVRALLHQVFVLARGGRRTRRRSAEMIRLASSLARQIEDPYSLGLANQAAGLAALFEGRWKRAGELLGRSEALLREGPVDWELTWVILWQMEVLCFRGHLRELRGRLPVVLKEVTERGNLLLEILLRSRVAWWSRLAADQPDEGSEELARTDHLLTPDLAFFRNFQLAGRVEIALYRGDGPAAWRAIEEGWSIAGHASLLKIQFDEVLARQLRSRAALAVAATLGAESAMFRKLRRRIRRDLRRIEAHRLAWGDPLAQLLRAGLETLRQKPAPALEHLAAAEAGFEAADMELYAAVSRRRRGQVLGAAEGARFITQADRWMTDQGIRNPAAIAGVLAPGVWDAPGSRVADEDPFAGNKSAVRA